MNANTISCPLSSPETPDAQLTITNTILTNQTHHSYWNRWKYQIHTPESLPFNSKSITRKKLSCIKYPPRKKSQNKGKTNWFPHKVPTNQRANNPRLSLDKLAIKYSTGNKPGQRNGEFICLREILKVQATYFLAFCLSNIAAEIGFMLANNLEIKNQLG